MKCERCGREYKSEECPTKGQAALCGDCRFRLDSGECNCDPYEPTCSFCQIRDMEEHTKMAGEIIDLRAALAAKDAEIARLRSALTVCRNDYRVKASGASPIMHASPFVMLDLCEKALEEK